MMGGSHKDFIKIVITAKVIGLKFNLYVSLIWSEHTLTAFLLFTSWIYMD